MNYEDTWELSLLMRTRADAYEKSAAEMRTARAVRSSLLANVLVKVRGRQDAT